jgi:hypothetical protein
MKGKERKGKGYKIDRKTDGIASGLMLIESSTRKTWTFGFCWCDLTALENV